MFRVPVLASVNESVCVHLCVLKWGRLFPYACVSAWIYAGVRGRNLAYARACAHMFLRMFLWMCEFYNVSAEVIGEGSFGSVIYFDYRLNIICFRETKVLPPA